MRALVVVALGAILIWFGLNSGDGQVDASGDGVVADLDEVAPVEHRSAEVDLEAVPAVPPADVLADLGGRDLDVQPVEPAPSEREAVEAEPARPPVREPAAPPAVDFDAPSDPVDSPAAFGAPAGNPARLSSILFEAWMASDPSGLKTYISEGEGVDLPPETQQLVAGFWEALRRTVDVARTRLEAIRGTRAVTGNQLALLSAAIDPPGRRAVPREAAAANDPLPAAMQMILFGDEARSLLEARDYARAAVAWSELIRAEINAPWPPHREAILEWGRELAEAQRFHRYSKNGNWPGFELVAQSGDSLTAIRKRAIKQHPGLILCVGMIRAANGLSSNTIHPGDSFRIPTDRANAIVDIDARVLLYRHGDEVVQVWDIGVGMVGHETPTGLFTIGDKIERPAHTTRGLPYGHPENPLGSRWMALLDRGKKTSYGIHGTSDESGVGGEVSLGCVRMRNRDVEALCDLLPVGAEVVIQH